MIAVSNVGASPISLDDKFTTPKGRVFMTGTQALIRLAMLQQQRDRQAGLHTAGFITGYRGSPLGGVDLTAEKAKAHLTAHDITFHPGLNEDLAATSVWGTQQVGLFGQANYDGVFSMWYGKGPGVDRCGDVFKHANMAGTAKHGGVLVIAGDDHAAKSSTVAHQSDHMFKACGIPVLYPSSVQEYLDYGLHGWAMSRYTGLWVAMKCVTDVVESGATVDVDPDRLAIVLPNDVEIPVGGLNIRMPDAVLEQERRMVNYKWYAALAYARVNRLNQVIWDSPKAKFGIITAGKSYLDTRQALADLGIDETAARDIGLRLFKVGMVWPLEAEGVRTFAQGLDEILVVEEKRQVLEYQLKEELYNWRDDVRPRVVGKFDDTGEWSNRSHAGHGNWLLPATHELSPAMIARAIAARIARYFKGHPVADRVRERITYLEAKEAALSRFSQSNSTLERTPHFCSGCPHNTSTKVPEGSRALAGIGCHYMVQWMDRNTSLVCQMGGEGVTWIGQAPFTREHHVFANLGDGTYLHSGLLAVRAAVAAKVNITYKVLFNDAVAMTGGQAFDGPLDPAMISRQLAAEGVAPIIVVTDDPAKYPTDTQWAKGVTIRHRRELDAVQKELRDLPGVSAMIYDQTCAAEKRRRRKRGEYPDPAQRVVINEAVCEGCGDCSKQSNCLSIEPVETPLGRKRQINQSSCNKDFSCVTGFCPSFVTVKGAPLRDGATTSPDLNVVGNIPLAQPCSLQVPFGALVTGIGGTGVITVGQILAMAAHIEGKACTVLDMSGLAQKGGPVMSHIRIAQQPEELYATRVGTGGAHVVIGCDAIVTASPTALAAMADGVTHVALNTAAMPTAALVGNPDWRYPEVPVREAIAAACGPAQLTELNATQLATALLGDALATNMFMLGFAWQKGWLPLQKESILRALELNATAVEFNQRAFAWGRAAAHDLNAVRAQVAHVTGETKVITVHRKSSLDEMLTQRVTYLTAYQNTTYADHYAAVVAMVRDAEQRASGPVTTFPLTQAVAFNYFKLLAYKDEYEVARLHTDAAFHAKLDRQFHGHKKLVFHLAPPLFAKRDPEGRLLKQEYGEWILPVFKVLAKLKFLRGTVFDLFGYTEERKTERALIRQYHDRLFDICTRLNANNVTEAIAVARIPEHIRGYGHIKAAAVAEAKSTEQKLWAAFINKSA